jgi:hypothetical protein
VIPLDEQDLRRLIQEYVRYYHWIEPTTDSARILPSYVPLRTIQAPERSRFRSLRSAVFLIVTVGNRLPDSPDLDGGSLDAPEAKHAMSRICNRKWSVIVCCNAGNGPFSGEAQPTSFLSRTRQVSAAIMRKTQDAAMQRMHHFAASGRIKGFVLAYLGQDDRKLPYAVPDLVTRDAVHGYSSRQTCELRIHCGAGLRVPLVAVRLVRTRAIHCPAP